MSVDTEQRSFPRYLAVSLPILIDAPSLSDLMLDPVDVSLGGFKVVVSERPAVGDHFDCSVEIQEKIFEECHGRVARVIENDADPPTWSVGMSLQPPADQRIGYEEAMKRFIVA
jgi:hypothetical protein